MSAVSPALDSRASILVETNEQLECIACGSHGPARRPIIDASPPARPFALHRCDTCGVVQQFPRWAASQIRTFYTRRPASPPATDSHLWTQAVQYYARLVSGLSAPRERRLLDVGCAAGHLAALARNRGWRVTGIDTCAAAVSEAAVKFGLDVRAGELSRHVDTLHPFDVILLRGVLEAAVDPVRLLADARKVLSPGGTLCIDTLNAGAFRRRWGGARWAGLRSSPVNLFDMTQLTSLLTRLGYRETTASAYTPTECDSLRSHPKVRSLWRWLPRFITEPLARYFNRSRDGAWAARLRTSLPRSLDEADRIIESLTVDSRRLATRPRGDRLLLIARR